MTRFAFGAKWSDFNSPCSPFAVLGAAANASGQRSEASAAVPMPAAARPKSCRRVRRSSFSSRGSTFGFLLRSSGGFGGLRQQGVFPGQVFGDLSLELSDHASDPVDLVIARLWIADRLRPDPIAEIVHFRHRLDRVSQLVFIFDHGWSPASSPRMLISRMPQGLRLRFLQTKST